MKKRLRHKEHSIISMVDPDTAVMMSEMKGQLGAMEKKIDIILGRLTERPAGTQHFAKPFRRFDGPPRFGGSGQPQGNGFRQRTLNKAVCTDCGKGCEVPFKPSGDRPVYCRDCFAKRREAGTLFKKTDGFRKKVDTGPGEEGLSKGNVHDARQGGRSRKQSERRRPAFRRKKGHA